MKKRKVWRTTQSKGTKESQDALREEEFLPLILLSSVIRMSQVGLLFAELFWPFTSCMLGLTPFWFVIYIVFTYQKMVFLKEQNHQGYLTNFLFFTLKPFPHIRVFVQSHMHVGGMISSQNYHMPQPYQDGLGGTVLRYHHVWERKIQPNQQDQFQDSPM